MTLNRADHGSDFKNNPLVFTEQDVYMLMTVLRGEFAVSQSKVLVCCGLQKNDEKKYYL